MFFVAARKFIDALPGYASDLLEHQRLRQHRRIEARKQKRVRASVNNNQEHENTHREDKSDSTDTDTFGHVSFLHMPTPIRYGCGLRIQHIDQDLCEEDKINQYERTLAARGIRGFLPGGMIEMNHRSTGLSLYPTSLRRNQGDQATNCTVSTRPPLWRNVGVVG